jgi:hypothetical protein
VKAAQSSKDARSQLPAFNYYLDESDPDIVILRRQDDSFVAAFSASGVTREGILEVAKEDYWELVRAHAARQGQGTGGHRSPAPDRHQSLKLQNKMS